MLQLKIRQTIFHWIPYAGCQYFVLWHRIEGFLFPSLQGRHVLGLAAPSLQWLASPLTSPRRVPAFIKRGQIAFRTAMEYQTTILVSSNYQIESIDRNLQIYKEMYKRHGPQPKMYDIISDILWHFFQHRGPKRTSTTNWKVLIVITCFNTFFNKQFTKVNKTGKVTLEGI